MTPGRPLVSPAFAGYVPGPSAPAYRKARHPRPPRQKKRPRPGARAKSFPMNTRSRSGRGNGSKALRLLWLCDRRHSFVFVGPFDWTAALSRALMTLVIRNFGSECRNGSREAHKYFDGCDYVCPGGSSGDFGDRPFEFRAVRTRGLKRNTNLFSRIDF
jgi:hypothetical protein